MSTALVRRLVFGDTQPTTIYECRDCGTTVDADADTCPNCGRANIAEYDLS